MERNLAKKFGKALRQIRKEKGISQEALALNAGFDRTYISLIERGLRLPSLSTLFLVAKELKVPAWSIIKRLE